MNQEVYVKIKVVENWLSVYKAKNEIEVQAIQNFRKAIEVQRNRSINVENYCGMQRADELLKCAYTIATRIISMEEYCSESNSIILTDNSI